MEVAGRGGARIDGGRAGTARRWGQRTARRGREARRRARVRVQMFTSHIAYEY